MKPFSDVKALMEKSGYTPEQVNSAAKQWLRMQEQSHTDTASVDPRDRRNLVADAAIDFTFGGDSAEEHARSRTPQDYRGDEPGLSAAVSPVELALGGGLGNMGKQMAKGAPAGTQSKMMGQGGWIGNKPTPNAHKIEVAGRDRYVDLDVIDDIYNTDGKYLKGGLNKEIFGEVLPNSQTPALRKHLGTEAVKVFEDTSLPSNARGYFKRQARTVGLNPNEYQLAKGVTGVKGDATLSHEVSHAINQAQGEALGTNPAAAKKRLAQMAGNDVHVDALVADYADKYKEKWLDRAAHVLYKHELGEVDANLTQMYHGIILRLKKQGKTIEEARDIVTKLDPDKMLNYQYKKQGGYNPELTWDSSKSPKGK